MKGKFEKIQKIVPKGADGILLTSEASQFYACGFPFTDGYVLVTEKLTYLLCDFRYFEAAAEAEGVEKILLDRNALDMLFDALNIKTLAYEDLYLTVAGLEGLKNRYPSVTFVPLGAALDGLREYKDEDELDKIVRAQEITDMAFSHILGYITPDRTEKDVAFELEFFMRSHGAEAVAFETIAVSGPASSVPHGVPTDVKLRQGFLTMDFGCKVDGYCSDMTRTVVIGKADEEMKKLYNTVLEAQLAALEYIDFGKECKEVDAVARRITDREYPGAFGHGLGHGVGLFIHERPNLNARGVGKLLTAGHVVTVEPGIYLPGKYGCRIEDMVLFYPDKCVDITKSPKELIEI